MHIRSSLCAVIRWEYLPQEAPIMTRPAEVSWFRDRDLLTKGQPLVERETEWMARARRERLLDPQVLGELPNAFRRMVEIKNPAAHR